MARRPNVNETEAAAGEDAADAVVIEEASLDDLKGRFASSVAELEGAVWAEREPGEPPLLGEVAVWAATSYPAGQGRYSFIARRGGAVIGMAALQLPLVDNRTLAKLRITVLPGWRRRRIGTRLFEAAVARARDEGRTTLQCTTSDRVPAGAAFVSALGGRAGLVERASELDLQTIDRDLTRSWVRGGESHTGRYELWWVDGPYPVDAYAAVAEIQSVMSTAPTDELNVEPVVWTAERIAENETKLEESPGERHSVFVRHIPTGKLVALTRVWSYETWPGVLEQGDTCVDPAHRGQGLGKWVKAAMVERVLERWPEMRKIRTDNAFSNGPMLAINDRLGFRVTQEIVEWQLDLRG